MIRAVLACSALCLFATACGTEKPEPQTPVDSGTHILPTQNCLDNDGDGVPGTGDCTGVVDCDDRNADVFPGATETCNNRDDNCDGLKDENLTINTYYTDADGDGYGTTASGQGCGAAPSGSVLQDGDCDDADASRHPGATETCNGIDDDCDTNIDNNVTFTDFYADADGDGFGDANGTPISACTATVQGRVTNHSDCDDTNPTIKPNATELCNRVDDNCDGQVDNGITFNDYYPDIDGDGFGDQYAAPESSCSSVAGKVTDHTDCDDARATTKPNAPEQCNDIDDNCNSQVDEGLTFLTYYTDADGDGYGATGASPQSSCAAVAGKVTNNTDCNDSNPSVKPSATEVCNGVDDDCAGGIDNGLTVYQYFPDADGDSYGSASATASPSCLTTRPGLVQNATDCNDGNSAVHPGATEICNNVDDNCDNQIDNGLTFTMYYPDADGDTYGATTGGINSCQAISGRVTNNTDCNDANAAIKPGATETCDNVDNNCNGSIDEGLATQNYYADNDGDGYGAGSAIAKCGPVGTAAGRVTTNTDCNDNNPAIKPGATEICNSIDDNCNGSIDEGTSSVNWYLDSDGDGYGASSGSPIFQCAPISGRVTNNSDCNDGNAAIKPGAAEVCDNVDNNCNGNVDEGIPDGASCTVGGKQGPCATGIMRCTTGAMTCTQTTFPATEVCDAIDNNCDGTTDNIAAAACTTGQYGRCSAGTTQCQGSSQVCVRTNGPIAEMCNSIDDDCNNQVDEGNPGGGANCTVPSKQGECAKGTLTCTGGALVCPQSVFPTTEICDSLDNDCNNVVDNGFANLGTTCTSGQGACANTGTNVCNAAHNAVVCNATAGSPQPPACDGIDNDCDGIVDEPVLNGTSTIASVAYTDIAVKPYYYSSGSCQGGAAGSGTDALAGGAMMMSSSSGITYQRLNSDGSPNGSTSANISLGYSSFDFAQAGDGFIVAGVWSYNNTEIDLYYLDITGVKRTYKYTEFNTNLNTLDSLRVVRSNGRKATLVWRENGVGIKMAKVEACYDGTNWTIQQAGCGSGTNELTSTTVAAVTTVVPGLGADSNALDWAATQTCQSATTLRTVGVAYRSAANLLKFFTINDDGTAKSGETSFTPPANGNAETDPDVGFFKDGSNVDAYLVTFVAQFASTSDVYFWRSNNSATYYAAWSSSAATGASSITRTRVSAKSDGFQIAALRVFESQPTYPTQLMTRNYSLTGVLTPSGTAVEIPVGWNASDTACSAGTKSGVALHYPWSRIYYSAAASTSASFDSVLTCN